MSVSKKHILAFCEFVTNTTNISEDAKVFLDSPYVTQALTDSAENAPDQLLTVLSDATYAHNFVLRWIAQFCDDWGNDRADTLAEEIASLVGKFADQWKANYAASLQTTKEVKNTPKQKTQSRLLDDEEANQKDYQTICSLLIRYLAQYPPFGVPTSDLVAFLSANDEYLEQKVSAIGDENAYRLLTLMHATSSSVVKGAHVISKSTETELQTKLTYFNFNSEVVEVFSRIRRRFETSSDDDEASQNTVADDDEEESDEAYVNTCKCFASSISFAPQTKSFKRYLMEEFLEDSAYFLQEKAHAIRKSDYIELARVFSEWLQETDDFLNTVAPIMRIEDDCRMLLEEYYQFMEVDNVTTDSLVGVGSLLGFGGNSGGGFTSSGGCNYQDKELQQYRDGHPELSDSLPHVFQNVDFYRGAVMHPLYRCFIDDFHNVEKYRRYAAATTVGSTWFGNSNRLESEHSYIQHLFPLQEGRGLSSSSQRLQKHELCTMSKDPAIRIRLLRSAELMLDFYGIALEPPLTIDQQALNEPYRLVRNPDTYHAQFANLNMFSHNYLRITRICKCLGDMNFEELAHNIIDFFIRECFEFDVVEGAPTTTTNEERRDAGDDKDDITPPVKCLLPNLRGSLANYWVGTVRDDRVRDDFTKRITDAKARLSKS